MYVRVVWLEPVRVAVAATPTVDAYGYVREVAAGHAQVNVPANACLATPNMAASDQGYFTNLRINS